MGNDQANVRTTVYEVSQFIGGFYIEIKALKKLLSKKSSLEAYKCLEIYYTFRYYALIQSKVLKVSLFEDVSICIGIFCL